MAPGRPGGTRGTRGNGTKAWRQGATAGCQGAKNSLLMNLNYTLLPSIEELMELVAAPKYGSKIDLAD